MMIRDGQSLVSSVVVKLLLILIRQDGLYEKQEPRRYKPLCLDFSMNTEKTETECFD